MLGLLHLLLVHRLVYHSGNLNISAKRKPSDAVFSIAVLWLELEQVKPRVEEEIEFLDPYLKQFREEEVSALVQNHKD